MMSIACLVAMGFMTLRYVSISNETHQSLLQAQERAKLEGAIDAIPRLDADYIGFLRDQNSGLLKVMGGGCAILLVNIVWTVLMLRLPMKSVG
jgi:hypothetical protein